jgi:DNA uptake protein ComE-like DNA-binding protein
MIRADLWGPRHDKIPFSDPSRRARHLAGPVSRKPRRSRQRRRSRHSGHPPRLRQLSPPSRSRRTQAQAKKININTATAAELDTLKGIGEARSKKIIEERAKAKFKNFDDLVKRNVLPSNVEADIKDKITF